MSFTRMLVVGVVALAACTGCAPGTGSLAESNASDVIEGQASPLTTGSDMGHCDGLTYNRAAGMCVSEGS